MHKKTLAIIANRNDLNSYIHEQYKSLCEYFDAVLGLDFFWEDNYKADYYLFHWPEYITDFYHKGFEVSFNAIQKRLSSIKGEGSKLIAVYHNKYPHYNNTEQNQILYNMFYSNMDGVICLGNYSSDFFRNKYSESKAKIAIIPHPCFETIPNQITKEQARDKLAISKNDFVILVFGSLRNKEEVKLFLNGFNACSIKNKKLLVVGGKIDHYSSTLEKWYNKLYRFWYAGNKLTYINRKVQNNEIQLYFNTCDLVLIPRINTLNSGVVLLAFSFGKPIVAPDTGNITEIINNSSNFLFNPQDKKSLPKVLNTAAKSNLRLISANNFKLSQTIYSQKVVAKQLFNFISTI